ncbi:MAG: hypothetical protein AB8H86_27335 [Polyangiales bacterium]
MRRIAYALVCGLLLMLCPNAAFADDAEDARAMFSVGILALEQGDNTAAHAAFVRSLELHPTSAAAFNLAGVLSDLDRPAESHALYEELARGVYGELTPEQQAEVVRLSAEVESALAHIEVSVVATGSVNVTIGEYSGVATEGSPFVQAVNPGEHVVRGTAEGALPTERRVNVDAGGVGRTLLRFEMAPPPVVAVELEEEVGPEETGETSEAGGGGKAWLWVVLGVVAAGGIATAVVLATRDSTTPENVLPATGTLLSF